MNQEVCSTITTKNQTTVPKAVRQALNLTPGDRVKYIIEPSGSIRISKDKENPNEMWAKAYRQEKRYGSIDTPELYWERDIESKDFD